MPDARIARLVNASKSQIGVTTGYDPSYVRLDYPGGDVPLQTGVCTDVITRALRANGFDLQKLVHEDMRKAFDVYPKKWNLKRPDSNIDHRRVPNLQTFLIRRGKAVPITDNPKDYAPGDIVTWKLTSGLDHIGLVTDEFCDDGVTPKVVHNWGEGALQDDSLFRFNQTGHYRFFNSPWKPVGNTS
jgi:uncharacterized protein YijF (DUF1287 family)